MVKIGKYLVLYLFDICIVAAVYAVCGLFMENDMHSQSTNHVISSYIFIVLCYLVAFLAMRTNKTIWRYANEGNYLCIFSVSAIAGVVSAIGCEFIFGLHISFTYHVLVILASASIITFARIVYKKLWSLRESKKNIQTGGPKRVLIIGAGVAASMMLNEIEKNPHYGLQPVALLDDDHGKQNRSIKRVKVLGKVKDVEKICCEKQIDQIIIAIPSATNEQRSIILDECAKTGCEVKILPMLLQPMEKSSLIGQTRDFTMEELLGREPIKIVDEKILSFLNGKVVAITGGGGSIGSELCRQIALHYPKRLIVIDIYENNAYAIQQELVSKYGSDLDLQVYIASVRDFNKIDSIFAAEKPDIVLHAAAHKHVPLMEDSPDEAVKNNVFGTINVAEAADKNAVEKFILISTDKAVNPTNIMGATKRVCEMVVQRYAHSSQHTIFAAVRFGNVLGSNGSVIPLFMEQIKNRRDVTVTHPEITRFFMTIPEASQLVLIAGSMAEEGEIFVLNMGEPIKIDSIARKMIHLSGLTVGKDIHIRYTGLRPGEKLYEELLMDEEGLKQTPNKKIFIGQPIPMDYAAFDRQLRELKNLIHMPVTSSRKIEKKLIEIVPTFKRYVPEITIAKHKDKKVAPVEQSESEIYLRQSTAIL